jgi:hypothetical protein
MSSQGAHDEPTLDDVMETTETVTPHHRDHAKTPKHLDDDELEERAEHELAEAEEEERSREQPR